MNESGEGRSSAFEQGAELRILRLKETRDSLKEQQDQLKKVNPEDPNISELQRQIDEKNREIDQIANSDPNPKA